MPKKKKTFDLAVLSVNVNHLPVTRSMLPHEDFIPYRALLTVDLFFRKEADIFEFKISIESSFWYRY